MEQFARMVETTFNGLIAQSRAAVYNGPTLGVRAGVGLAAAGMNSEPDLTFNPTRS
jgi:hypothetical protein